MQEYSAPRQCDNMNLVLHNNTKESRRAALLGQTVKIETTDITDTFVDDMSFNRLSEITEQRHFRRSSRRIYCQSYKSNKTLSIFIAEKELKAVASDSAINAARLAALLGYRAAYTLDPRNPRYDYYRIDEEKEGDPNEN